MNQTWKPDSPSPQSGRQNLAQGEASAASETLGSCSLKNPARFSGRKTFLSPAKAGSLSASTHRHLFCAMILASIVCLCFGCNRGNSGGISSGTGGFAPSANTPASGQVSSSTEVVKVSADAVQSSPGTSADAIIRLAINSGYHINANPATYSYLIATEVKIGNSEGISAGTPTYPVAAKQKFEFADEPLAVYEGNIEVKLPLKIGPSVTGQRSLPITVRVQACDTEKCFPPATLNATVPVEVK